MWNSALREKLISIFQEFLYSINKIFILTGRLGIRLSFESAKLRVLHAKNVLACQRALRVYVFTCQCALHHDYVFKCQRTLRAYVLTCQRALCAYALTCQRVLRTYVLTCQCALRAYMLTCQRASFETYLTSNLLVSEKVTNSGGLMLVCRWAGVNVLAQNKFRSTIHLLGQHLLA